MSEINTTTSSFEQVSENEQNSSVNEHVSVNKILIPEEYENDDFIAIRKKDIKKLFEESKKIKKHNILPDMLLGISTTALGLLPGLLVAVFELNDNKNLLRDIILTLVFLILFVSCLVCYIFIKRADYIDGRDLVEHMNEKLFVPANIKEKKEEKYHEHL